MWHLACAPSRVKNASATLGNCIMLKNKTEVPCLSMMCQSRRATDGHVVNCTLVHSSWLSRFILEFWLTTPRVYPYLLSSNLEEQGAVAHLAVQKETRDSKKTSRNPIYNLAVKETWRLLSTPARDPAPLLCSSNIRHFACEKCQNKGFFPGKPLFFQNLPKNQAFPFDPLKVKDFRLEGREGLC